METLAVRTWRSGIQFQHCSLPPLPSLPSLPSLSSFLCSNATTTYNTPPPLIYSCFRAQTGSSLQPALLQSREGGGGRGGGGDTSRMLSLRQIQLINSHTVSTSSFLSPAHEKTPKKKLFFLSFFPQSAKTSTARLHLPSSRPSPRRAPDPHYPKNCDTDSLPRLQLLQHFKTNHR